MIDVSKCSNYDQDSYFEQQKKESEEFKEKLSQVKYITEPLNYNLRK